MRIQTNVTDKFLRNMIRIKDQLGMIDISAIPGQSGSFLECNITNKLVDNPNKILKEISDDICPVKVKEDKSTR